MSKKVVIQCSGGIESTVLIGRAIQELGKANVFLIAFDTDSLFWRHRDSIAVKRVCTNFQMQQQLFICRMPQVDLFEYVVDDQYADVGFLPGYKMMYNTVALAYAQRVGAEEVWIGNMADNVYPDESEAFNGDLVKLYNRTYAHETGHPGVRLMEPFKEMTKGEVINYGISIGVNVFDTVSCGEERTAGGYNCGICPWCQKRRRGFEQAGVVDRTRYLFVTDPLRTDLE